MKVTGEFETRHRDFGRRLVDGTVLRDERAKARHALRATVRENQRRQLPEYLVGLRQRVRRIAEGFDGKGRESKRVQLAESEERICGALRLGGIVGFGNEQRVVRASEARGKIEKFGK